MKSVYKIGGMPIYSLTKGVGFQLLKVEMSILNSSKVLIPFTKNVMLVRDWEKKHLPVENSALALDLFLLISYNTLIDKPLTLKLLFHSTVFSEAGIRKHLRRWVDGDWCLLVGDVRDKRLKYVVAQPKMLLALSDYLKVLNGKYKKSARPSITTPPTVVLNDT